MKIRITIALRAAGWLAVALASASAWPVGRKSAEGSPNFVIILVDDLRWDDLGIAGHPFVETPAIDRMAREGVAVPERLRGDARCARRAAPAS